jgi:hypothetical protein
MLLVRKKACLIFCTLTLAPFFPWKVEVGAAKDEVEAVKLLVGVWRFPTLANEQTDSLLRGPNAHRRSLKAQSQQG